MPLRAATSAAERRPVTVMQSVSRSLPPGLSSRAHSARAAARSSKWFTASRQMTAAKGGGGERQGAGGVELPEGDALAEALAGREAGCVGDRLRVVIDAEERAVAQPGQVQRRPAGAAGHVQDAIGSPELEPTEKPAVLLGARPAVLADVLVEG